MVEFPLLLPRPHHKETAADFVTPVGASSFQYFLHSRVYAKRFAGLLSRYDEVTPRLYRRP